MLLAIIASLSLAQAHPVHRPVHVVVHVETEVHPISRWVNAHYDRWGRWVPGHWTTVPHVVQEICHTGRDGHTWCEII
jgi:hypothetical protein